MGRETLMSWAESLLGIFAAIFASVGVVHGFDHATRPDVLLLSLLIATAAAALNGLTLNKSPASGTANPAVKTISPRRAALMAAGLVLFGLVIIGLGSV